MDNLQDRLTLDVSFYWQILLRRLWIVVATTFLAVVGTAVVVFSMRPIYQAKALVLIEKEEHNTVTRDEIKIDSMNDDYYETQYAILKSHTMAQRVVDDLHLTERVGFKGADPAAVVQAAVQVKPVPRSRLVEIQMESSDPKLAMDIVNSLARSYCDQNLENRLFLSKDVLKALESKNSTSVESLPAVVSSPLIQDLKIQYSKLQGLWAEMSHRYQPRHPKMVQLEAEIKDTKSQIDLEVRHIAESVKMQLSGQLQGNNVRIVDPALFPDHPIKPRKRAALLLALLMGLAVGFSLAFFVDQMDLAVRNQDDVERTLRMPFLGGVQRLSGIDLSSPNGFSKIWTEVRSHSAEAFRNLRTAISFRLSSMKGSTAILVTSSVQGEGKSLIAANIARAFSQAGERVLLIDGDLRRPNVHRMFQIRPDKGLSTYLTSGEDPSEFIVDSGVANLKLLPCGPIPDHPSELLTDRRLKNLLGWASGEFDRIIIDSPPVYPVTDSLLWARQVHATIFVVLAAKVRAAVVSKAIQKLKEGFANIIGVVLNQSIWESAGYYYYYGYYSQTEPAQKEATEAGRSS